MEIFAAEAHCHHLCYKNYARMKTTHEDVRDGSYQLEEACINLFEYIRSDITPNKKVV